MSENNKVRFINVSGFHNSGSSSVVNLLKEYKDFYEGEAEMRLIKDPYGLAHLERELTGEFWGLINASAAITDFLDYAKKCARYGKGVFSPAGLSYAKYINPDFVRITEAFIKKIVEFEYKTDFYHYKFRKSYLKYVTDRIRNGLDKKNKGRLGITNSNIETCYFAHPSREQFDNAVKDYFEELYTPLVEMGKGNNIILDQAISPNNTQVMHRFFRNAKMFIVKRDPRDMYMNDIMRGFAHNGTKEDGQQFAIKQKALRSNVILDDDMMEVQFEELVLDCKTKITAIEDFLGIKKEDHLYPERYFNIEKSRENVFLWKKAAPKYQAALRAIEELVPEMCLSI